MNRAASITVWLLAAILFLPVASAQYTYSVFHTVSSTASTSIAVVQTSAHDAVIRFPSMFIWCSGACSIRVYEGGTIATGTPSATYPKATKKNIPTNVLTQNLLRVYTASNATGGTVIGGVDCSAACIYPITGILPDRGANRHSMELARKTESQYYFQVTGSSIDVGFSGVLEVIR